MGIALKHAVTGVTWHMNYASFLQNTLKSKTQSAPPSFGEPSEPTPAALFIQDVCIPHQEAWVQGQLHPDSSTACGTAGAEGSGTPNPATHAGDLL